MPPPSSEPPWPAAPSRIVRWLIFALPVDVTRNARYLSPPLRIVVRALAPTTVMSDAITRSSLRLYVPAGTLIVSATPLSFDTVIAARRPVHACVGVARAALARAVDRPRVGGGRGGHEQHGEPGE